MSSLKEKLDIDEILSILIGLSIAGTFLMWFFYTTFPFWDPEVSLIHRWQHIVLNSCDSFYCTIASIICAVMAP
jgi:hypothetical protein